MSFFNRREPTTTNPLVSIWLSFFTWMLRLIFNISDTIIYVPIIWNIYLHEDDHKKLYNKNSNYSEIAWKLHSRMCVSLHRSLDVEFSSLVKWMRLALSVYACVWVGVQVSVCTDVEWMRFFDVCFEDTHWNWGARVREKVRHSI